MLGSVEFSDTRRKVLEESKMGWGVADMTKQHAIYITRCDIGWYSKNANAYRKPLEVATRYAATLYVPEHCHVPKEIAEKCVGIVRFRNVSDILTQRRRDAKVQRDAKVFTGFDFPCMFVGWQLKRQYGCQWTVFLWDPPSLSHRDRFPPLRWAIDTVFRFFAKRCDRLVLNIHPGLLDEIGYKPREGQLELRMQDAFEGMDFSRVERAERVDGLLYDFGVLAEWSRAKGGELLAEGLKRMPGRKCLWIGDPPKDGMSRGGIEFAGRLPQDEAFGRLRKCRILVVPYLATRAFKWNYPLKVFEYLQLGRPILASDNPGNVAVASRYSRRITLFKSGDVADLVEKALEIEE